jgi:hypothetical protein
LLAIPILGFSQAGLKQNKTGFKNMPLKIWAQDVSSQGLVPLSNPQYGKIIDNIPGVNGVDTLVYLPNENFLGVDVFSFEHFTDYPPLVRVGPVQTTVKITIVPSFVEAQHDYTVTTENKATSIRVIANDSVTHGALTIDPVFPVVNHGSVKVGATPGTVDFTPEKDFTGLADFNYIACDSIGTCATGAVTVYVNPTGHVYQDELRLGTGQNTSKAIPMPFHITRVEPATNVRIEKSEYAIVYEPGYDFTGQESFTVYGENGNQRTILMDVIKRPINSLSLAQEDVVYGVLGETVSLNILENDLFNGVSKVEILAISGGTISSSLKDLADGNITFVPEEGFRGVATILYRVFDNGYELHLGNVYVVYDRNNFGPNVRDYTYTFKLNPGQTKLIDYKAPIDDYRLSPTAGFDNVLGIISAESDQVVKYEAPEEAGIDEFEISYCVPANSTNCQQIKVRIEVIDQKVETCAGDCVYPGDLNADGIVNSADILPLGLYVGTKGPARADQSSLFKPYEAEDWDMSFVENKNTVNLKHYDADGDGIITQKDAAVISKNYGAVKQLVPNATPALSKGLSIAPSRVTPSPENIPVGEAIPAGSLVQFDILLGEEGAQELDLYGFTFPFKLSGKSLIDLESFEIAFNDDSWAALNSPTLNLAKDVGNANSDEIQFDLAFTRTNKKPVSGIGAVMTVSFVVIDDLDGFKLPEEELDINIEIGNGYTIDGKGKYYQYAGVEQINIPLSFNQSVEAETLSENQLIAYPNPVDDEINVHLNSFNYKVRSISLYNVTGSEVYRSVPLETKRFPVPVHNLAEGLYIMSVQTDGGVLSKKIEVLRK